MVSCISFICSLSAFPSFQICVLRHATIVAPKYWERINYIGHFETAYEDTQRLLVNLGAWEDYGASGWTGRDGQDGAIFDPRQKALHGTKAQDERSKEHYFTATTRQLILKHYMSDYQSPWLNFRQPGTE